MNRSSQPVGSREKPSVSSRTAGRFRLRKLSTWPLTTRVVVVTVLLSSLATFAVGGYLSHSFANSLHAQRYERALEQSKQIRNGLVDNVEKFSRSSPRTQKSVLDQYVAAVSHGDPAVFKGFAVTRLDEEAETTTNNDSLQKWAQETGKSAAVSDPSGFTRENVTYVVDGENEPAFLLRTHARAGGHEYELLFLYSLAQEQETADEVNTILLTSAVLMLVLIGFVSLTVSRIVRAQLRRAAEGAERISRGELNYRVPITGSDELARVGTSFNDMAASLEQQVDDLVALSHVQKRFVADVSHELRTPLTTIKLAAAILESEKRHFPANAQRATELLSEQAERFHRLLGDLLEMSRHDARGAQLETRESSLAEVVDSVVEELAPILSEHNAVLTVRHMYEGATGTFDERRVARIVRNLLTNAIEHRMDKPVLVETAANDTVLAVVVQDFGVGVNEQEAARVFDRFWRANPARSRTLGGTGLGLSISREDADLHGGKLEVWGRENEGAVFRLTLPRCPGRPMGPSPLQLKRDFLISDLEEE